MQYQWFVVFSGVFDYLIISIALRILASKFKWKKRWQAWVPGLRAYSMGEAVGMNKDGIVCGVFDALFVLALIVRLILWEGQFAVLMSLIHLVFFIFLFVYRMRIFVPIIKIFGLRRSWILLALVAFWLPLLILGISKKYQPKDVTIIEEHWEAGTKPAELEAGNLPVVMTDEGLSINIRARTVKDFGKKRYLLKDIALNIPRKSLVLLLGGSGSGKTTMINAIIGYEKADATILLNGTDVYKNYNSVKYKIGFVPQQNLIRGKDSVIRTVNDAAKIKLPKSVTKEERKERIDSVMDLLGLKSGQQGLVSKKSGGQLRRICIAMELVADPDLFVLDEPDSGLDGVISREIFTKLRQIADQDRIVLVITHTPDRVIDLFDKVIVLGRDSGKVGRLAFYGSPDEAREFFGKDSMEQIVMSVNSVDEGGEGRADEMIEKFIAYVSEKEGGMVS